MSESQSRCASRGDWKRQSPTLVLRARSAELHLPQVKQIAAKKVRERKQDPQLVTVAVDLNVRNLAVITIMAWTPTATAISKRSPRSSGNQGRRSKASTATVISGGILIARTRMPPTRSPTASPRSAPAILAVSCSLSAYARSSQARAANRGA